MKFPMYASAAFFAFSALPAICQASNKLFAKNLTVIDSLGLYDHVESKNITKLHVASSPDLSLAETVIAIYRATSAHSEDVSAPRKSEPSNLNHKNSGLVSKKTPHARRKGTRRKHRVKRPSSNPFVSSDVYKSQGESWFSVKPESYTDATRFLLTNPSQKASLALPPSQI